MSLLHPITAAIEAYNDFVKGQIDRARRDPAFADQLRTRWRALHEKIGTVTTPTGIELPRLALPEIEEPAEIARYLYGEGLPGEFPYVGAIYSEMYLAEEEDKGTRGQGDKERGTKDEGGRRKDDEGEHRLAADAMSQSAIGNRQSAMEEPTRLFAGLGLAEDTNARFHFLREHQRSMRLSTAFDGPTLYGIDSDADGAFGKIGEGGVAIDTVEDMERLYANFPLDDDHFSCSMTINAPAPILLAMYIAAARRRFGDAVVPRFRGTVQADILKEVQAQNEMIFPIDAALRFLGDMVEYCTKHMPRWYPISISGYHIAEAGATPVQQAAYTLSNGFAYVELFKNRGMDVNAFGPRLSFFLDCGLDIEYLALARVCRKIWAIGMRDVFGAGEKAQRFKLHTQTSGRSLVSHEFKNNLTRTAVELMLAYMNATNSCHSNSADEPFTTPGEEYVRLASHAQSILLEESGLFKLMTNALAGSPGMKAVERAVEAQILEEFREIDRLGGVLGAVEHRYQRSQIQSAAHRYERQIHSGQRPIIGLNRYRDPATKRPEVQLVRTAAEKKKLQIARLAEFKKKHARDSQEALDRLASVVEQGGNTFEELIRTVEHCSLGQITARLHEIVGHYRPTV